jgi:5-carboxymethyl-2-hydroxymuconic-semialdehyde dehydrogenase
MTLHAGDVILTGTPEGVVNVKPATRWSARSTASASGQHPRRRRPSAGNQPTLEDKPMRIQHLINGKRSSSREYFETVNPATQEVLAEVAAGGAAEVNAAVAAAKAAFPKWAGKPAAERAKLMRKLGDLIAQHVPEIARTETRGHRPGHRQTGKQLVPRAADNFYYFAEMCTRVDGHTYPTPTHLNYTLFHPVGVCALISPWNVPFMTATWKVAPCAGLRQHGGAEDERAVAADGRAPGRAGAEAGIPPAC